MKRIPWTLWQYLARRYIAQVGFVAFGLLGLVYIFESFELLRRAGGHDVPLTTILSMALLKLPETGQVLFPFVFLLAGLSLFWQLGRASELVIMRAVGVSAWRFVAPVALVAFACGVFNVAVLQPIGSFTLERYAALEERYLGTPRRVAALNEQGLWLRDSAEGSVRLFHARDVSMSKSELGGIMILDLDSQGRLLQRLDATTARFDDGDWVLGRGMATNEDGTILPFTGRTVETAIKRQDLLNGFTEAATFSFWVLPKQIDTLAARGFPTRSLILYYQNLLATPFLWIAMALIAISVSLTPHRFGKAVLMLGVGIGAGFFYFLFARYFEALSLTQRIPEFLAAWVPVLLATILPVTFLFQEEDG